MTNLEAKNALRAYMVQNGINGAASCRGDKLIVTVAYQHNLPAAPFATFEGFPVEWRVIGPSEAL